MRKHQQKQILDMLPTLKEAQDAGLYADCQDGALGIGEYIESIEGEGTQTVALLEDYCELVFKASNGEIGERVLRKQLIKVENSIKSELKPNKVEMAFLSYKASMSDALESIYLAAKEDPDCDAYWIPIPYVDRKTDGSAGAMYYEGADHYSGNIECTDWREYDIEARHPDVIFTFNPYDGANYVTSVHPDYYCQRLRELTDCLVYVPYFVVGSGEIAEHFCIIPGCIYAHKVIVQSETIRQEYIRWFRKSYGEELGNPEEKFIALGSPKFDKVINSKREDFEMPDEWTKIIDGKKVILYNTTVGALLLSNEQYLKKLRNVLDTFKARGDIALWWRPHPLMVSTCESMRPRLLGEYEAIVAEYRSEGWGIYDNTADLHRAIAWTDAYYGDWSSLVALYQAAGKACMVQAPDSGEYSANLTFQNICEADGYFWFTPIFFNALFRMDKQTWKAEYMGSFLNEKPSIGQMYLSTVCVGSKLYFAPHNAERIAVYDIENGEFCHIGFMFPNMGIDRNIEYNRNGHFSQVFSYEQKLVFTPYFYPGIMVCDTHDNEMKLVADWINALEPLMVNPSLGYFGKGVQVEDRLFLPCFCANAIVEYDLSDDTAKVHELLGSNCGYRSMTYDGDVFWLLPVKKGPLVSWNPVTGEAVEHKGQGGLESIAYEGFHPFADIIQIDEQICCIPLYAEKAIMFNINEKAYGIAEAFQRDCDITLPDRGLESVNYWLACKSDDDTIFANARQGSRFIRYTPKTDGFTEVSGSMSGEVTETIKRKLFPLLYDKDYEIKNQDDCVFHEMFLHLNDLICFLTQQDYPEPIVKTRYGDRGSPVEAGKAIYDYCTMSLIEA